MIGRDDEVRLFCHELRKVDCTITVLDLRNFESQYNILIADALKENSSVTEVDLTLCNISPHELMRFLEILRVSTTIRSFLFDEMEFSLEIMTHIARVLYENCTLRRLDISFYHFPSDGLSMLPRALRLNKTLTSLSIQYPTDLYSLHTIVNTLETSNVSIEYLRMDPNVVLPLTFVERIRDVTNRNIAIGNQIRYIIYLLIWCRNNKSGIFACLPKEITLIIAHHVWNTRGDCEWILTQQLEDSPQNQ